MKHDLSKQEPENAKKRKDGLTEAGLNSRADRSGHVEPFSTGENENFESGEAQFEDGPPEKNPKDRPRVPKR